MTSSECLEALSFLDEMLSRIQSTRQDQESGFVACTKDGSIHVGATCKNDGNHCSMAPRPCDGAEPVFSFHTHSTRVSIVAALTDDAFLSSKAEELALLPSERDVKADVGLGVRFGCVGGLRSDGMAQISCYDRTHMDAKALEDVRVFSTHVRGLIPGVNPQEIPQLLRRYREIVGEPCLQIQTRAMHPHERRPCVVCDTKPVAPMTPAGV